MNDIKSWCKIICIVSIVSGVLLFVLPKSKLYTAFKGLVSLLLITCFVLPLSDKDFSDMIPEKSFAANSENDNLFIDNSSVIVDCAEELLEEQLDKAIADINYSCKSKVYISESQGDASLDKIEISGNPSEADKENIIAKIKEKVGGDVVIEFVSDTG